MLKPGGRLLITDYCRAAEEPSASFASYISQRGYHLHPVQDYGAILSDAGFYDVKAEDRTWQVTRCLSQTINETPFFPSSLCLLAMPTYSMAMWGRFIFMIEG